MDKIIQIAALGDSITQGFPYDEEYSWVNIISEKFKVPVSNHGICGDFTSGMLKRFREDIIPEKPDGVIILGGYNDAFWNIPPESVGTNFSEMCSLAYVHNIQPVLGLPTPIDIDEVETLLAVYRRWIKTYSEEHNISLINFYGALLNPSNGRTLPGTTTDGAHPSIEGYKLMADAVELDRLFNL